ncbi:MAG: RecQ family ATP-dependent DNA helicase [Candidatus Dormibacteria bacterium]
MPPPLTPSPPALAVLRDTFGLPDFRPGQRDVVAAAEAGQDVLLVAPTGAGKSIAYWVPGLVVPDGLTLVVSPLIALMADQIARLTSLGIPAAAINSHVARHDQSEAQSAAAEGGLRFLYVAPERFAARGFMEFLGSLRVSRFVVDEAHCISGWGHDFRPDYRRLGDAVLACGRPPVGAFTATATPRVRDDIVTSLGMRDTVVRVTGFVRAELMLQVRRCRGEAAKLAALDEVLPAPAGASQPRAIVYCGRTRSTEVVARHLKGRGMAAAAYHGSLTAEERRRVHDGFLGESVRVIAATSAFGMGIDLPDIRQVVHLDFPGSIEAYYQEAGRAGRDGLPATCTLLYNPADRDLQAFFIDNAHPPREVVRNVYRELLREGGWHIDDWGRRLPSVDARVVRAALDLLGRSGVLLEGGGLRRLQGPPVDFEEQALLRDNAYARVNQIMEYATSRQCRHARIATYFGEDGVAATCLSCDTCVNPGGSRSVAVEDRCVIEVLRCVDRFDGHLGAVRIATILRGTLDEWAAGRSWVRELSFFGSLAAWPVERIRDLLSELIDTGCLRRNSGERPTLGLTPLGRRVMSGRAAVAVVLSVTASMPPASRRGPRALESDLDQPAGRRFQALRSWRLEVARRDGVPAFTVFDDRTLREIAGVMPATLRELASIRGVGPAKLERHGEDVLRALGGAARGTADGT